MRNYLNYIAYAIMTFAIIACGGENSDTDDNTPPTPNVTAITITVNSPGMLSEKISPEKKYYTTSLKIKGKLNGTDIWLLRDMAGCDENMKQTSGTLAYLDLSEAQIVSGGKAYAKNYYTEDNVVTEYMFNKCKSLVKIVLPNSTTKIEGLALTDCNGIKSIDIPKNVKAIEGMPFDKSTTINITDLKAWNDVDLNNSIFNQYGRDYKYTYKGKVLRTLDIPASVTNMSNNFTYISEIETVNVPATVRTIGYRALSAKNFKNINIADGVEEFGERAFENDSQLKEIKIPKSVKALRSGCFWGCTGLTKMVVPSNVEAIEDYIFADCNSLTSVDMSKCRIEMLNKMFL